MKTPWITLIVLTALWGTTMIATLSPVQSSQAAADLVVYADALASGWQDWGSWDTIVNYSNATPVYSGTASIAATYTAAWGGLYLHANSVDISAYDTLRFWLHGGGAGGQRISVSLNFNGSTREVTATAAAWQKVEILLSDLGSPATITDLVWQDATGGAQSTFYLDNITFIDSGTPPPPPGVGPALSVNAAADRHPISPYVYGINFASEAIANAVRLPVRRWGGNSTSRFNWQLDVHNTGSDWYFENIPDESGTADQFVDQDRRTGTKTLLTMPLIGWTPKQRLSSHPYDCGFKVSKYGDQVPPNAWMAAVDPYDTDCGSGVKAGNVNITGNDPHDTSVEITTTFVISWINHLIGLYGTATNGGVMFYNLDNEPMLWNSTHRDVHPTPTTYDEMHDRTLAYAAAIKAADPTAKTLGPVVWGWCAYFYSAADGCSPGTDRQAHGNVDFVEWYLQQMRVYEQQHGVRILDYVDVHIYPQIDGVYSESLGSADVQAKRLRSTRQLWDTTYVHEDWIAQPVYLIPRMKQWVTNNYTGTKLAITEYNWGALGYMNGALAQADLLGIFGREGLDLATLWGPPDNSNAPGVFAFRMYRNYDGTSSAFGETSVRAVSTDQDKVAIYAAQRSSDLALTLIAINKTGQALTSTLTLTNFQPAATAQVYRYSAANLAAIVHESNQVVTASGFTTVLPANSVTLFIVPPGGGPVTGVNINGPTEGLTNTTYTFIATVNPLDASTPITYTWSPGPISGQGTFAASYSWNTPGLKTITVTAANSDGGATGTHAITITKPFTPVASVNIAGLVAGVTNTAYTFVATVSPPDASTPITYTWSPGPISGQGTSAATFSWNTPGVKTITVTVTNDDSSATDTHAITIVASGVPVIGMSINGPTTGMVNTTYIFTAAVSPPSATLPITYTWSPGPISGQGTSVAAFRWSTGGIKIITATVQNNGNVFTDAHSIAVWNKVYLPIVLR